MAFGYNSLLVVTGKCNLLAGICDVRARASTHIYAVIANKAELHNMLVGRTADHNQVVCAHCKNATYLQLFHRCLLRELKATITAG